jgi:hypothetical protein
VWGLHLKDEAYKLRGSFCFQNTRCFFHSQHDIILGRHSNKIYHGTCRNIGYTQVGVALTTRLKIANVGAKDKGI